MREACGLSPAELTTTVKSQVWVGASLAHPGGTPSQSRDPTKMQMCKLTVLPTELKKQKNFGQFLYVKLIFQYYTN